MMFVVRNPEKCGMVVFHEAPFDRRAEVIAIVKKGEILVADIFLEHIGISKRSSSI